MNFIQRIQPFEWKCLIRHWHGHTYRYTLTTLQTDGQTITLLRMISEQSIVRTINEKFKKKYSGNINFLDSIMKMMMIMTIIIIMKDLAWYCVTILYKGLYKMFCPPHQHVSANGTKKAQRHKKDFSQSAILTRPRVLPWTCRRYWCFFFVCVQTD